MSNRLDLNSATSAELLTLRGLGKTTAKKLIAFRETHDPPLTYQQLIEELGISLKRINRWVAGSILPLSEDPPHVSGEEMSSATSANESSEEEQPVDTSFVDWQSKVRLLEEEGAVLVSETDKQMEVIHSLSRDNYSLKEQLSERESELSVEIIKSSRLEETIEQLRRDREDQQALNNKLQDLLAQEKTNHHFNLESAAVLKDSLTMATETTNNINLELINKTDACRQTEDLLAQATIKGDTLRIQVMQLTDQNNTLIGETQKLRIDTGRLQELVTNLQSSTAPGGKVTLNPYVTRPMINPSPLDHLAQHALVTPSIPPPPLATHSTVHLQYEDTQVKGKLNNHGQARGGDTEGTASSYHRPDKSTHHDLAPMSAPPGFQHIQRSPQQTQPLSTTRHVNDARQLPGYPSRAPYRPKSKPQYNPRYYDEQSVPNNDVDQGRPQYYNQPPQQYAHARDVYQPQPWSYNGTPSRHEVNPGNQNQGPVAQDGGSMFAMRHLDNTRQMPGHTRAQEHEIGYHGLEYPSPDSRVNRARNKSCGRPKRECSSSNTDSDSETDSYSSDDQSAPRTDKRKSMDPAPPRMSTFDGEGRTWRAFKIQFREYSRIYKWNTQTRLDRLMASLRGKALLFIGKKDRSERRDYKKLMKSLERRYGLEELPSNHRKQLLVASQESTETLEDFAERVYTLTTDGYPEAGKDLVVTLATDYFLKGCRDKYAALSVSNLRLRKYSRVVSHMREFINNQRVLGVTKPASHNARQVTFDALDNDSIPVKSQQPDTRSTSPRRGCSRCGDLRHSATDCRSRNDNYRTPSPSGTCFTCGSRFHFQRNCPEYKPKDSGGCYSCGDRSHLARDCPRGMRPRTPSPNYRYGPPPSPTRRPGRSPSPNDRYAKPSSSDNRYSRPNSSTQYAGSSPNRPRGRSPSPRYGCNVCGDRTHADRDCPRDKQPTQQDRQQFSREPADQYMQRNRSPTKSGCFNCGDLGHFKVNCPKLQGGDQKRANLNS